MVMSTKTAANVTQLLPTNWAPTVQVSQPEPRRRYPRDTASLALTTVLPVLR